MVLLLFNDRDQWTFKEIQQQTEIPVPELKRALQGMMQGKSESPTGCTATCQDVAYMCVAFVLMLACWLTAQDM